jgi:homoserine dehydrogenase
MITLGRTLSRSLSTALPRSFDRCNPSTLKIMPKIYVAVVGTGLVGSSFLDQLEAIPSAESPFQLVSLTSSRKHLFFPQNPLKAGEWRNALSNAPQAASANADLDALPEKLQALAKESKVVVIDNTASDEIAARYPAWTNAGLSVITPNKKAFSGPKALYEEILAGAKKTGSKVLHEATVGAGLPVINTLNEMLASGDKVRRRHFIR